MNGIVNALLKTESCGLYNVSRCFPMICTYVNGNRSYEVMKFSKVGREDGFHKNKMK